MANTTFSPGTLIESSWLNDVNDNIYEAVSGIPGTSLRTPQQKFTETVSVKDFGAVGDGVTDNFTAITAAITYIQSVGGGRVLFPRGTYKCNTTITVSPVNGWHNVVLEGEGANVSILDFSGSAVGTDGLAFAGWGGRFELRSFAVKNAKRYGINLNSTYVAFGGDYISRVSLRNLVIDTSTNSGLFIGNAYMIDGEGIEARNNGGYGFEIVGFCTSLTFRRCWGGGDAASPDGGNALSGWYINGTTYSTFEACGADWNGQNGYRLFNTTGVTMLGCGAESNQQEGWFLSSSDASTAGVAGPTTNIKATKILNCFAYNNSKQAINVYANFLGAITTDARPISFTTDGCADSNTDGTTVSLVLNGTSGAITHAEQDNSLGGSRVKTGTVDWTNRTNIDKNIVAQLSGNQSIPNNTTTALAIDTIVANRLNATIVGNAIVVPAGVNRIRVTAGINWDTSAVGTRVLSIRKNGLDFPAAGRDERGSGGIVTQNVSSAVIEVTPGDTIGAVVLQTSGGALNILNNQFTFLAVEAAG